jgi:restriction endonuclease S subunit
MAYPTYKDSSVEWLGTIPTAWEVKRLRFVSESNPVPGEVRGLPGDTEVSFVPMEAVGERGGLALEAEKLLADVKAGYTYFRDGDVVIAKITPCFENLKGALADGLTNGIAFGTTELHVLRASEEVNQRFAFYVTMSDAFRRLGEADMYGAGGQKRISESFVRNFPLALPPVPEQRAIATFLDRETARIDALVAKKERLIRLLQERRTALITRAVTKGLDPTAQMKDSGVEWLGEIPAHWEVKRLRHLALGMESGIQMGPFGSMLKDLATSDTGYKVYGQENTISGDFSSGGRWLTTPQYDELRAYRLRAGDIVLTRKGSLGNARLVPQSFVPGIIDSDTIRVRVDRDVIEAEFLVLLLHEAQYVSEQIGATRRGAVLGGLNTATISDLHLAVPTPREQERLVHWILRRSEQIDRLISGIRTAITRLHELRTALISAAVTGKIDVRETAQ